MMMTFFFGLVGYTTALVAQYLGAGRKRYCAVAVAQAVLISLAAGSPLARREQNRILNERIDMLLAEARQMNVDQEVLIKMIRQRGRQMHAKS